MASQQLYSYLGRAALWKNVSTKLAANGAPLAPCDAKALRDLCAGVTWMQRVPPALLASYRALYVILRGDAAEAEEEINRDILRTVRAVTGLLLDFSSDQRGDFAGSINRVLNALAHVDDMGYCQGQNYVVDVMMKAGLPERETFCLFLYLLRQGHLHGIYRKEVPMLAGYMDKFEEQLRLRLPHLAAHFETENYPPPLYALEWITTLFGLAAQPLISLVALDLFLAGARNPVLRLCVSLLGGMQDDLLTLDQEGLLKEFRSRAVELDAEDVIVRALSDGGGRAAEVKRSRAGADRPLGWSTGPDYLLVLRSRHCQTVGLVELREEARNSFIANGLLADNASLQDALLSVTRSLGWDRLRVRWLESSLAMGSDHERYQLANESLRFVITNGGHCKAACFMLGVGGADANGVDSRLLSPLHLVALFNRPDVARVLLMCGASPRLVGGVTRAAAARGGKLWSPLEMAEEACTEGGELDEAAVAVGPAALFVLRGLVCLQCNVKLPKPTPCKCCRLTFCKSCSGKHFCVGQLDLPRGMAESADGTVNGSSDAPSVNSNNVSTASPNRPWFGDGPGNGSDRSDGGRRMGGRRDSERRSRSRLRLRLGSAIGDGWEELFSEGNTIAEGQEDWKPGKLRRAESTVSKAADEELDMGASGGRWTTMSSVILGTWERKPLMASPRDREKVLDNSATFVRACFPAQSWLQYHMQDDMGLLIESPGDRYAWGGPFKALGLRREYFNPKIMEVAESTELHRRMSWVMAESGVPWEDSDQTWCCPECFILFSLNVFRHHCRGCGKVFCNAHAPPTPVPTEGRLLKLCWSCVLEGAAPLPSPLGEDISTSMSFSPKTARTIAEQDSPTMVPTGSPMVEDYVAPHASNPRYYGGVRHDDDDDDDDDERQAKKGGGGFLSALVSLIEVVAAPNPATEGTRRATEPIRNTAARRKEPPRGGPPDSGKLTHKAGEEWRSGWFPSSGISVDPPASARAPSTRTVAATQQQQQRRHQRRDSSPPTFRKDFGSMDSPPRLTKDFGPVCGSPVKLRKEYGSSASTAASTEVEDDQETHLSRPERSDGSRSSSSSSNSNSNSGGGARGVSASSGTAEGGRGSHSSALGKVAAAAVPREQPVGLGFPSERPWAHGFGSG